jgi:hypothetical protein
MIGVFAEPACCQATGENESLDAQVLGQFEYIPGAFDIGVFIGRMVFHGKIIVPGQVHNKIGTAITVYAFDHILQVGEITNIYLGPSDVFMSGDSGFLLGSPGKAKQPVPVCVLFNKMPSDKS